MAPRAAQLARACGLAAMVAVFLALRLPALGSLPLYSDEAIGIWRAERVLEGSLTRGAGEGKPLHAWIIAAALLLPLDPVVAARGAHVVLGAVGMIALWALCRRGLSARAGWVAATLWVVLPFPMLLERTVTPDLPLAAAGAAALALGWRLVAVPGAGDEGRPGARAGGGSGRAAPGSTATLLAAGAAALFVKMPAGVAVAGLPVLLPWALPPERRREAWSRIRPYAAAFAAITLALASIVAIRALLGLRPLGFGVHELALKVPLVRSPGKAPAALLQNLGRLADCAVRYLGPLGTVLLLAGAAGVLLRRVRLPRLCLLCAAAWCAIYVTLARDLSAHYLLPALPLLVPAMAWALVAGAEAVTRAAGGRGWGGAAPAPLLIALVLVAMEAWALPFQTALWLDPPSARLAEAERAQYLSGPWSGYGLPAAAEWIDREAAAVPGSVFLAVHVADYERLRLSSSGGAREALVQAQIDRYTLPSRVMIERALERLGRGERVYVVVGSGRRFSKRWSLAFPRARRRASFPKPGSGEAAEVWELEPST